MRTTLEINSKLLSKALTLSKAKTKRELIERSLEALIREQRIHHLVQKLGRFPMRLTPKKLAKLRSDV